MLETFKVGEIGFFILIGVLSIIYTMAVESNRHFLSIVCTLAAGAILFDPLKALLMNWQLCIGIMIGYILIGGMWSVFRWAKYCQNYINVVNPWDKVFHLYVNNDRYDTPEKYYSKKLTPIEHRSLIISWIVYWPWSMFWNVSGDLVKGMFDCLTNIYKKIAATVIKRLTASIKFENSNSTE